MNISNIIYAHNITLELIVNTEAQTTTVMVTNFM